MSNDVYGYIEGPIVGSFENNRLDLEKRYDIGIEEREFNQLFNFPEAILPKEGNNFIFTVGDSPREINATASYLIDYIDYASEADIGFPVNGKERLDILLNMLKDMMLSTGSSRLAIALTDMSQIECVRHIKLADLFEVVHADFEREQQPPDTLYIIEQ